MMKMLTKMFKRKPTSALAAQVAAKFTQPMLMHPTYGRSLVSSYLSADQFFFDFLEEKDRKPYEVVGSVAVLDISGGLMARESDSIFDIGMVSYEGLRGTMQELLDDESIDTIVGRFDSPGGMAAQNMDISDFIYASRDQGTKLIAMVDDMAYSAAYGIASAFDEIWITRTGGVGSVGVVSYHVDQSAFDKRMGIDIEYIYAGDKKVLGNPHEPLSEAGRAEYQKEVDRLYNLFTATVARNLGLSVDDVKATQAGTFHGEEAIEVGFATKLGTFDELMASLNIVTYEDDDEEGQPMDNITDVAADEAVTITATEQVAQPTQEAEDDVITDADPTVPVATTEDSTEAAPAVEEQAETPAEAEQEAQAEQRKAGIRALCMAAGKPEAASDYIASGMELSEVRETLLALTSTSDSTIITSASVSDVSGQKSSASDGWERAFAKAQKL